MIAKGSLPQSGTGGERGRHIADRIRRGVALFAEKGHGVEWLAEDRCKVPSRTRPGVKYLVVFGEDGERCRCRDHEIHGAEYGVCLHIVCALIASAKRPTYRVERVHDSRVGRFVYVLVERRAGLEREVSRRLACSDAWLDKWAAEGYRLEAA